MKKYASNSEQETKKIAEDFAKSTKATSFALSGELGAGKTIFVQGFAKGLGITEKIISPTFVLIRQHQIPRSGKTLYHIDLYRLDSVDSKQLGLSEILAEGNSIVLIEWAEKLNQLPEGSVRINIEKGENQNRKITIS